MDEFGIDSIGDSDIERVVTHLLNDKGVHLSVKREDSLHPTISGNKWRKLKYNIKHCLAEGIDTIVTYGGAFSNHIYATAAAAKLFGLHSVGIIRGEYDSNNPTIQFAISQGMHLEFVSRAAYKLKNTSEEIKAVLDKFPESKLIPEGGSNELAILGLEELAQEINSTDFDIIMVSAGTGTTAAGIVTYLEANKQLWVFSSLKSTYLEEEIRLLTPIDKQPQLRFFSDCHFGGYGKTPSFLIERINSFVEESDTPLDPIYNGKLIAGFIDMVQNDRLDCSKKYLWIHTGGLQGIKAYNYMADKKSQVKLRTR